MREASAATRSQFQAAFFGHALRLVEDDTATLRRRLKVGRATPCAPGLFHLKAARME